jgi:predicted nucleotide-binding protein
LLSHEQDTRSVEWTEVFQPGYLTFEALEAMLLRCCGAVFVATPDNQSVIRGEKVSSPRANIMLEFGLVAGRMGRHNIALCQYAR